MPFRPRHAALLLSFLAILLLTRPASAVEFFEGRIQIHGYSETQLRAISSGFDMDDWYWSQWANVLNVEIEADIAPNGFGPFDLISSYARIQVRYDCIWSKMCGLDRSQDYFGDRSYRGPKKNTNAKTPGVTGILPNPDEPSELTTPDHYLSPFTNVPPLDVIGALGGTGLETTFAPVSESMFGLRKFGGTISPGVLPLGPWQPRNTIHPSGVLRTVPNFTQPLPFRPLITSTPSRPGAAQGLYAPSAALRERMGEFGSFDQNFREPELAWDHGASQDEHELREAYIDAETLDGRLWMRLGKQSIVWGKTELFRTTDQFNPQDLALSSLPSFEDSRIALWSARFVYSLYDVGPLEDVRAEFAVNLDDFQSVDLGRCGEPYTIFLVCGKSVGLFAHGVLGAGIAGEIKPPNWWDSAKGLEYGARLEWRWDRFSFALTDFYGYNDFFGVRNFNSYSRKVDPVTGQPLDRKGNVIDPAGPNLAQHVLDEGTTNRQFYDVFCSATVGIAGSVISLPGLDLSTTCALDLLNSPQEALPGVSIANVLSQGLTGGAAADALLEVLLTLLDPTGGPYFGTVDTIPLNVNTAGESAAGFLDGTLTTQQKALLGCGPFYGTSCNDQGIDLANAEASVLLQAFPQFEPGGPVATRYVNGRVITLPGARGPFLPNGSPDPSYDPRIDGCVDRTHDGLAPAGYCNNPANTDLLALGLHNELGALSANMLTLLTSLGTAIPTETNCTLDQPLNCDLVRAIFGAAGTQRPDLKAGGNGRFGRRDFFWHGGSEVELFYHKRNVLGLSADFAEDTTKTNWGVEFTWVSGDVYANTQDAAGYTVNDSLNLTISVDRPTFVNFLNSNRTFLFNSQWFIRYINDYRRGGVYAVNGPLSALGTFTIMTGYFQDRLLPSLTFVHDVRSTSGGILGQLTYRYSESFSATVGVSGFYGRPEPMQIPVNQIILNNNGGDFRARTKYDGVSPLAQQDEIFFSLRYTF